MLVLLLIDQGNNNYICHIKCVCVYNYDSYQGESVLPDREARFTQSPPSPAYSPLSPIMYVKVIYLKTIPRCTCDISALF